MSNLVVITFADEESGSTALGRVKDLADAGRLTIVDSAVITKDADGKTKVDNQISEGAKTGGFVGGAIGLMISIFFLPVFGLIAGAVAGSMLGRNFKGNVDKAFVDGVTAELTPGTSALFVLVGGDPNGLTMALAPFKGKVFQTTLDNELEDELNKVLRTAG